MPTHAAPPRTLPEDEHNRRLDANVRPAEHENPVPAGRYNLVVVGAGTAGLVAAHAAAALGARVALVERERTGGDCLNVGCVPSKGIIRSARAVAEARGAYEYGVVGVPGLPLPPDAGGAPERPHPGHGASPPAGGSGAAGTPEATRPGAAADTGAPGTAAAPGAAADPGTPGTTADTSAPVAATGAGAPAPRADFAAVMARMRRLRAEISRVDSVARLRHAGVDVYLGEGRFVAPDALEVGGRRLEFARACVATGTRPARLPVPGLDEVGFLTNETVFSLTALPRRLAVIGGGPIGCELAQAFRRLGAEVTLLTRGDRLLPRDDPDASAVVRRRFEAEGISLVFGVEVTRASAAGGAKRLDYAARGATSAAAGGDAGAVAGAAGRGAADGGGRVVADEVLVAVGRVPNVEGLGLEAAGVEHDARGVRTDDRLRTTSRRIYAAGDIAGRHRFTHAADAMARIVVQNALFLGRRRVSRLVVPWVTYTDPEVAQAGLTAAQAERHGVAIDTYTIPLDEVDRAVLDGETEGFARAVVRRGTDRPLGFTIVARHAGEMIGEAALALTHGLGLSALSATIHPYPTQAEAIRKLGDAYRRSRLTPRARRLIGAVLALRR